MTAEIIVSGAAVVGVIFTGAGLLATWRKNGASQAARDKTQGEAMAVRDAVLASNQRAIIAKLDDKDSGLQAVNKKVGDMSLHCANVSGPLIERVTGHDREIYDMKRKT